ncbi:MAG TPA: toast rack family protein [Vicinamibacterales bacterium]|jgi:hypothetical protein|nr:toast rack family protein [Vicinamibacterales bacterium]
MRTLVTSFTALTALAALTVAGLAGSVGCNLATTRESQTITRTVELDHAESVDVELKMGAGELHVEGGAPKLLDASFRFNVPSWEPVVDYQGGGSRGRLRIEQGDGAGSFGNTENTWSLKLNDDVPIDLVAHLGAGQATMAIGALDLRRLEIHQGVGELQLDLRGTPEHSYEVNVNGGVGSAHIRLPHSVGIVANATGGIGSIDVSGLSQRGDTWYNPNHENDPVSIRVNVKGGVGEIKISADDTEGR